MQQVPAKQRAPQNITLTKDLSGSGHCAECFILPSHLIFPTGPGERCNRLYFTDETPKAQKGE